MRRAAPLALSLLSWLGTCLADDAAPWNSQALSAWVGKYPTAGGARPRGILDEKPLGPLFEQTVPAAERRLLGTYTAEAPVKAMGDFLIVHKCRPHDCPAELAMIVIDLRTQRLWAGFFVRQRGRVSTRWYGSSDDYSVLPAEIRQEFLLRHGN